MIVAPSSLERTGRLLAFPVITISALALAGWSLDVGVLYRWRPDFAAMNPMTAVFLSAASVALLLSDRGRWQALASLALSLWLLAMSAWQLVAVSAGFPLRPDMLLFGRSVADEGPMAAMVPETAIITLCFSTAIACRHPAFSNCRRVGVYACYAAILLIALTSLSYAFGAFQISDIRQFTQMAPNTTVAALLLTIGILLHYNQFGATRMVVSRLCGGRILRLMLPAAIVVPTALGLLSLHVIDRQMMSAQMSLALFTTLNVIVFIALMFAIAWAIEQTEKERQCGVQMLSQSEARLSAILSIAADAIVSVDARQRITLFNAWAEKIFGYASAEVLGKPLSMLIPERFRSRHSSHVRSFGRGEVPARSMGEGGGILALRKDGTEFPVEATMSKLSLRGEEIYTVVLRDVTERQKIEEELLRAKEDAESASNLKSEFLANMSHEIRTPLNSISGFTQLLLDRPDLPDAAQDGLKKIRNSTAALTTVVNDILDYSKLAEGKMTLMLRPFSPLDVINNCVSIMSSIAGRRDLPIEVQAERGFEELVLLGDKDRIQQVLLNLLTNAIKFTHHGCVTVIARADNEPDGTKLLRIWVRDTGIGIPEDRLGRLFERFSQVDGSMSRSYGGTGLGLAICKRIVRLIGGEIGVESEYGKGSTFWFSLPLMPAQATVHVERAGKIVPRNLRKVLLIEDTELNREIACAMLEAAGHSVTVASNGTEALKRAAAERFELILMDIQMPDMDGLTVTQKIRSQSGPNATTPIVAMTANVLPEQVARFHAVGMDAHIPKPIDRDELLRIIDEWQTVRHDAA